MEEQQSVLSALNIDEIAQMHLISIAKWNRFLAITGIVGCIMGLLTVLGTTIYSLTDAQVLKGAEPNNMYLGLLFFVICITAYLIPCFFRLRFANKMLKAIVGSDQYLLNESLRKLQIYSKYFGIAVIVSISMGILLIIFSLLLDLQKL